MRLRIAVVSDEQIPPDWYSALQVQYELSLHTWSERALEQLAAIDPEMIICDLRSSRQLPETGFRHLRGLLRVPILVLGPARDEQFVVHALKLGADGCINAPFGASELLARVEAHLRRYWEWEGRNGAFHEAGLLIDHDACSVVVEDRMVKLTPTECRLLSRLAEHEGEVVPREELSRYLWGLDDAQDASALVSLYIHYLRKKLERDPRFPRYIRTKRGGGYYLAAHN